MNEADAKAVAKATVAETFLALGVDISTPDGIISTQKDFAFVRTARYTLRRAAMAVAAAVALALLAIAGPRIGKAMYPESTPSHPYRPEMSDTSDAKH